MNDVHAAVESLIGLVDAAWAKALGCYNRASAETAISRTGRTRPSFGLTLGENWKGHSEGLKGGQGRPGGENWRWGLLKGS